MRLGSVRAGDIVRVDDGMPYLAEVIGRGAAAERGYDLRVMPLTGPRGVRGVRARQVVAHWRRVGARVGGCSDADA